MNLKIRPGAHVLVRGRVTDDGHAVRLGPGIEANAASLDVAASFPDQMTAGAPILLVFASENERAEFAAYMREVPGLAALEL